jgi:ribosomal protein S18 acetylase RimI-like enzyme
MSEILIRPLRDADLASTEAVFRLAFGTHLGLPDPTAFGRPDRQCFRHRWTLDPSGLFVAETDGQVVGSSIANRWGRVGFFGPLTVHPEFWDRGIGGKLMEPAMAVFADWGVTLVGLFTFADSAKHQSLYQKFGFWPRFLTHIMTKPVGVLGISPVGMRFSELSPSEQIQALYAARTLTGKLHEGLDLTQEIEAIHRRELGETLLLRGNTQLEGLAVCHCGPGSEGGSETCKVKFAAVQSGRRAPKLFDHLLEACEAYASSRGAKMVEAGVNTSHLEAYQRMRARGFRSSIIGVAMHKDNVPGYSRPGLFVLDDWR